MTLKEEVKSNQESSDNEDWEADIEAVADKIVAVSKTHEIPAKEDEEEPEPEEESKS